MKIDKKGLPYRKGVIGLVINKDKQLLLVQMIDYGENHWRFPGGGVEEGETAKLALLRELSEELGTNKFDVIKKSKHINTYDWPDEVIERQYKKKGIMWRGQQQSQFLVKYIGKKSELHPLPEEIRKIKWVAIDDLKSHLVFPRQWELAQIVVKELIN